MIRHWIFSGRVQGVGFRYTCSERARLLGLDGWVKNLPDGRVEALVQGPPSRVGELLAFLQSHPGSLHVDTVAELEPPDSPPGPGFRILR